MKEINLDKGKIMKVKWLSIDTGAKSGITLWEDNEIIKSVEVDFSKCKVISDFEDKLFSIEPKSTFYDLSFIVYESTPSIRTPKNVKGKMVWSGHINIKATLGIHKHFWFWEDFAKQCKAKAIPINNLVVSNYIKNTQINYEKTNINDSIMVGKKWLEDLDGIKEIKKIKH